MSPNKKVRRSSIFLLELMITILLFSVNSAVCIRFFIQAHDLSRQTDQLTRATDLCTQAAELLRAAQSPRQAQELLQAGAGTEASAPGKMQELYPDGSRLIIQEQAGADLYTYQISYLDSHDRDVYSLTLKRCYREVES